MKQADTTMIEKLLNLCKYIKWKNVDNEEWNKLENKGE